MTILLTGGLGYVGSHIAKILGKKAIIIDNKSNSQIKYSKLLPNATVYLSDLNSKILNKVFKKHHIQGVIHLAGLKSVSESTKFPLKYFNTNIKSSIDLLESMDKFDVNKLIFSSSATVYGNCQSNPIKEYTNLISKSPYASTKIIIENLLNDYSKSNTKFKAISLRYFNPIGADTLNGLSEQPIGVPQNILPVIMKAAYEKKIFKIYGNDYDTRDGTCIRDYIHVKDLAYAHALALKKITKISGHISINVGIGKGLSVLELVKLFQKENRIPLKYIYSLKRKGDVPVCFADNKLAKKILDWKPQFNHNDMVKDAWKAYLLSKT